MYMSRANLLMAYGAYLVPDAGLDVPYPGYVPGYEGMYPPPEGMLFIPWAQGTVKCTLIKH